MIVYDPEGEALFEMGFDPNTTTFDNALRAIALHGQGRLPASQLETFAEALTERESEIVGASRVGRGYDG